VPRHEDLIHRPVELPPFGLAQRFGQVPSQHKLLSVWWGRRTSAQLPDSLAPFDSHAWRSSGASVSLRCTKRFINSAGTGWAKTVSAAGLAIARIVEDARLVFHLHHQDRVLAVRRSCAGVSSARRTRAPRPRRSPATRARAVPACRRYRAAPGGSASGRADPHGRVARQAVLPRAEPQQHQAQLMDPRFADQAVDELEIEPPLLGLGPVPRQRGQPGVEMPGDETIQIGACIRDWRSSN